jgi:hypothetical protein
MIIAAASPLRSTIFAETPLSVSAFFASASS